MKRFDFRLQKVLEYRMSIEDEKKMIFISSRNDYIKELTKLDDLKQKLEKCSLDIICQNSDAFWYIIKNNYASLLRERIDEQSEIVKIKQEEMEKRKQEFQSSQKDRKIIEKLKENEERKYNQNLDKLEQKQNDEFAIYGYVRK